jgi:hypothetical protein
MDVALHDPSARPRLHATCATRPAGTSGENTARSVATSRGAVVAKGFGSYSGGELAAVITTDLVHGWFWQLQEASYDVADPMAREAATSAESSLREAVRR